MKTLLTLALGIMALFIAPVQAMDHSMMKDKATLDQDKPTMVVFTSATCGSCKILSPKVREAMGMMADKHAFNVVVFDMTDETTKAAGKALAKATNLTNVYDAYAPKTGFRLLYTSIGSDPVKLNKKMDVATIKATLDDIVNKAQLERKS